jgi:hypothetical protein
VSRRRRWLREEHTRSQNTAAFVSVTADARLRTLPGGGHPQLSWWCQPNQERTSWQRRIC